MNPLKQVFYGLFQLRSTCMALIRNHHGIFLKDAISLNRTVADCVGCTLQSESGGLSSVSVGKYWMTTADAEMREFSWLPPADDVQYLPVAVVGKVSLYVCSSKRIKVNCESSAKLQTVFR